MSAPETGAGDFPATPWTMVMLSRGPDTQGRGALGDLCSLYWKPLYAFIRRKGHAAEEAEDLTQGFFAQLLERDTLTRAEQVKGRLRSYLLGALKYYLVDAHRRATTGRAGAGVMRVAMDAGEMEAVLKHEGSDGVPPDVAFEKRWAVTLLEQTLDRLREEMSASGKAEHFEVLSGFLSWRSGPASQAEGAAQLGMTENAFSVAVHRLRKRFQVVFRAQVAATVETEAEVEEEIRHLRSLFR